MIKWIKNWLKKEPYEDWSLYIFDRFILPPMMLVLVFVFFYTIWAWYMGYPIESSDVVFIQPIWWIY